MQFMVQSSVVLEVRIYVIVAFLSLLSLFNEHENHLLSEEGYSFGGEREWEIVREEKSEQTTIDSAIKSVLLLWCI